MKSNTRNKFEKLVLNYSFFQLYGAKLAEMEQRREEVRIKEQRTGEETDVSMGLSKLTKIKVSMMVK